LGLGYNIVYNIIFVSKIILSDASVRPCLPKSGRCSKLVVRVSYQVVAVVVGVYHEVNLRRRGYYYSTNFFRKKEFACVYYAMASPRSPRSAQRVVSFLLWRIGSNFTQDNIEENQLL
jgi:hypothetical protein